MEAQTNIMQEPRLPTSTSTAKNDTFNPMNTTTTPHTPTRTAARFVGGSRRKKQSRRPIFQHRRMHPVAHGGTASSTTGKKTNNAKNNDNIMSSSLGSHSTATCSTSSATTILASNTSKNKEEAVLSPTSVVAVDVDDFHEGGEPSAIPWPSPVNSTEEENENVEAVVPAAVPKKRTLLYTEADETVAAVIGPAKEHGSQRGLTSIKTDEVGVVSSVATPNATSSPLLALPTYAWKLHDRLMDISHSRRWWIMFWTVQIISLTALTITAAVVYAQYYVGYPALDDPPALSLFSATVIFPFYIMYLARCRRRLVATPDLEGQIALQLKSETFKFRTEVGNYYYDGDNDESNTADSNIVIGDNKNNIIKDRFREQAQALWAKAGREMDELPEGFWNDHFLGQVEWEVAHSVNHQGVATAVLSLQSPETQVVMEGLPCIDPSRFPRHRMSPLMAEDLEAPQSQPPTETTQLLPKQQPTTAPQENDDTATLTNHQEELAEEEDDRFSMLTPEKYIQVRVKKLTTELSKKITTRQQQENLIDRAVVILTMAAGVTAILSLQWIIPIILAFTAAGVSSLEAGSFRQFIESATEHYGKLETLRLELEQAISAEAMDEEIVDSKQKMEGTRRLVEQIEAVCLTSRVSTG